MGRAVFIAALAVAVDDATFVTAPVMALRGGSLLLGVVW
jgi:hypothetical protein